MMVVECQLRADYQRGPKSQQQQQKVQPVRSPRRFFGYGEDLRVSRSFRRYRRSVRLIRHFT